MFEYDAENSLLVGPHGSLAIPPGEQASLKMAMLLQGECTQLGPTQAAKKFNYSKSRYYQLREAFTQQGIGGLANNKSGPNGTIAVLQRRPSWSSVHDSWTPMPVPRSSLRSSDRTAILLPPAASNALSATMVFKKNRPVQLEPRLQHSRITLYW